MNPRQILLIHKEKNRIRQQLANDDNGIRIRCITAVAKSILLAGSYNHDGRHCNPVAKSIGAGVYEIWLEDKS